MSKATLMPFGRRLDIYMVGRGGVLPPEVGPQARRLKQKLNRQLRLEAMEYIGMGVSWVNETQVEETGFTETEKKPCGAYVHEWCITASGNLARKTHKDCQDPILPILSWDDSQNRFGCMHPDAELYVKPHRHHNGCGHTSECAWPSQGEPCQAYEHWDEKDDCWDCFTTRHAEVAA
jgi:hypothetical protein